jgi:hypothetical protein
LSHTISDLLLFDLLFKQVLLGRKVLPFAVGKTLLNGFDDHFKALYVSLQHSQSKFLFIYIHHVVLVSAIDPYECTLYTYE